MSSSRARCHGVGVHPRTGRALQAGSGCKPLGASARADTAPSTDAAATAGSTRSTRPTRSTRTPHISEVDVYAVIAKVIILAGIRIGRTRHRGSGAAAATPDVPLGAYGYPAAVAAVGAGRWRDDDSCSGRRRPQQRYQTTLSYRHVSSSQKGGRVCPPGRRVQTWPHRYVDSRGPPGLRRGA